MSTQKTLYFHHRGHQRPRVIITSLSVNALDVDTFDFETFRLQSLSSKHLLSRHLMSILKSQNIERKILQKAKSSRRPLNPSRIPPTSDSESSGRSYAVSIEHIKSSSNFQDGDACFRRGLVNLSMFFDSRPHIFSRT